MATAAVQKEQINELLQCSVCIDVFTDPRTLQCMHTFCFKCIADWCKDKQPGNKVACPECRQGFDIPGSGIDGLKKNFFIGNLLSMTEAKQKAAELCEICVGEDRQVSEMFCLQCEQSYCKSCSNAHLRMKICSSHVLVSLNELPCGVDVQKKSKPIFCDKHTDKLIELYCLEDKVAICLMCCVLDHRSHHCEEIKKAADKFHVSRQEDLQSAMSKVEENLEVLNSRKLSFLDKVKNVETQICKEAEKKTQIIENHKQKLLSELNEIKRNHGEEMNILIQKFTRKKSLLTDFTYMCNELYKEESGVELCSMESSLNNRTGELIGIKNLEDDVKKLRVTNVIFSPSSEAFEDSKNILGQVEVEADTDAGIPPATAGLCMGLPDWTLPLPVSLQSTLVLNSSRTPEGATPTTRVPAVNNFRHKVTPVLVENLLGGDKGIASIAMMNDQLFVIRCNVKYVLVYDSATLQSQRNIQVPRLGDLACGLAACPVNDILFISDEDNSCVHRVDLSTGVITNWKVPEAPRGLSVTGRHSCNLIVTCCSSPASQVREYTHTGKLVRSLSYNSQLFQAIETRNGSLLATCRGEGQMHGLVELSWEGRMLRCYGNTAGSGKNQMHFPRSFAVDCNENIIVADMQNDRIRVLNSSLKTAITLQMPCSLQQPFTLCYDESLGRLFVGVDYGRQERLLVFDHVTNLSAMFRY